VFWNVVYAQEGVPDLPPPTQPTGNPMMSMLWMVVLFIGVMYFLMIRPNQKREQERQRMLGSLAKGDRVMTSGGIVGTVVGLTEKTVVLRVNEENTKIEFARNAVAQITSKEGAES
jgi:preprotein translocase subunit YajC